VHKELTFDDVVKAHQRIKNYVEKTPVITNKKFNDEVGNQVFFKLENLQRTRSFKARGAFNAILAYKEKHKKFPDKIVAQSSGNHAQGVALACKEFGIPGLIYMAKNASPLKVAATRELGAEVILCEKRTEANRLAEEKQKEGYFFIHPADGDDVIAGQGTACLEALQEIGEVAAIFAPCGGGGLISGSFLAAKGLSPKAKIFACEPLNANDAARSVAQGKIFAFADSPNTIADGARTLAVSEQSFYFLKKLSGILEITEEEIISGQKKLSEILEMKVEVTPGLGIAGLKQFLKKNPQIKNQKFLVIVSGGNC
jgi:threonine dehydratase